MELWCSAGFLQRCWMLNDVLIVSGGTVLWVSWLPRLSDWLWDRGWSIPKRKALPRNTTLLKFNGIRDKHGTRRNGLCPWRDIWGETGTGHLQKRTVQSACRKQLPGADAVYFFNLTYEHQLPFLLSALYRRETEDIILSDKALKRPAAISHYFTPIEKVPLNKALPAS